MLPDAQLASEAGTYRPDKQGKTFAARMSDELEPLHRVRWSWQPQGPPGGSVDGKRACGSKLLAQQVQTYQMHTPVCRASALCRSPNVCAGAELACCPCHALQYMLHHSACPSHERTSWRYCGRLLHV